MLGFFLVVDGVLLYRYQLLQESQGSGALITALESEPTAEAATTPNTTSTEDQKALRVAVKVDEEPAWLRVVADGQTVLAQQRVWSGFSATFEADKELELEAWNAGAVSAEVNGKDVGRLGKRGEDLRWTFALE